MTRGVVVSGQRGQVIAVLDRSRSSDHVLRWAAREATSRQVPLRLIQTFTVPTIPLAARLGDSSMLLTLPDSCQTTHDGSAALLSRFRRSVAADHPDLAVTTGLECGSVVSVSAARSAEALLTVIGTRREYNCPDSLFGSVPARIIGQASGPIVIIPPPRSFSGRVEPSVVVALDGWPGFGAALGFAFQAAAVRHHRLWAVHTWDAGAADGVFGCRLTPSARGMIDQEKRRRMDEELAGWRVQFPEVDLRTLVLHGRPAPTLLHFCRRQYLGTEPALVVVVSRGHRGGPESRPRPIIGSLITRVPCPIAVVHAD
jgi:nucleotide-binding universal stress UspA family protein